MIPSDQTIHTPRPHKERAHRRTKFDWGRPGVVERLGEVSDAAIAREIGCTRQRVEQVRRRLGIISYEERAAARRTVDHVAHLAEVVAAHPEILAAVGTDRDGRVAAQFGVAQEDVRAIREAMGREETLRKDQHGNRVAYNAGCRCEECRAANAAGMKEWIKKSPEKAAAIQERARKKVLASAPHRRGKIAWYVLGCRCAGCRRAHLLYSRKHARRKRAQKRAERARSWVIESFNEDTLVAVAVRRSGPVTERVRFHSTSFSSNTSMRWPRVGEVVDVVHNYAGDFLSAHGT